MQSICSVAGCLICTVCSVSNREGGTLVSVTFPAVGWCLMLPRGTCRQVFTTAADVHWCRELGRQRSIIELDTPSMTAEQIEALERSVNEKIRERVPVTVRELAAGDPDIETVSGGRELVISVGPR